jgi:hypothetical protein
VGYAIAKNLTTKFLYLYQHSSQFIELSHLYSSII